MKRRLLMLLVLVMLSMLGTACAERTLEVYLIDPCGACMGAVKGCSDNCVVEDEAYTRYRTLTGQLGEPCTIVVHNVRNEPERYNELTDMLKDDAPEGFELPMLMIDGKAFPADGTSDEAVLAYLQSGEYPGLTALTEAGKAAAENREARRVLYFYSAYCEDCKAVSKWIDHALSADVEIVRVDIGTGEGMLAEQAVHTLYGIPEDEFYVPLVIYGDQWLMGRQEIMFALPSRIEEFPDAVTPTVAALLETKPQEQ